MLIGDNRFRALRLATGSRDAARDRGGGRALSSLKPERRAEHGLAAQAALEAVEVADALRPDVATDAVLVTDAARCYPPCTPSLGLSHIAEP